MNFVIKQFTKKAKIDFNFWYDVEFDPKFNYFNFVKDVTNVINGTVKTYKHQSSPITTNLE